MRTDLATRAALSMLAAILFVAGCNQPAPNAPPEIVYGEDVCDECGMIISDPRFAAAVIGHIEAEPVTRLFDDVGEMAAHAAKHPELVIEAWHVHDYDTEAWIDGTTAAFVVADSIQSPMGTGIAAFADGPRAAAFAEQTGGTVYDLEGLLVSKAKESR